MDYQAIAPIISGAGISETAATNFVLSQIEPEPVPVPDPEVTTAHIQAIGQVIKNGTIEQENGLGNLARRIGLRRHQVKAIYGEFLAMKSELSNVEVTE